MTCSAYAVENPAQSAVKVIDEAKYAVASQQLVLAFELTKDKVELRSVVVGALEPMKASSVKLHPVLSRRVDKARKLR